MFSQRNGQSEHNLACQRTSLIWQWKLTAFEKSDDCGPSKCTIQCKSQPRAAVHLAWRQSRIQLHQVSKPRSIKPCSHFLPDSACKRAAKDEMEVSQVPDHKGCKAVHVWPSCHWLKFSPRGHSHQKNLHLDSTLARHSLEKLQSVEEQQNWIDQAGLAEYDFKAVLGPNRSKVGKIDSNQLFFGFVADETCKIKIPAREVDDYVS